MKKIFLLVCLSLFTTSVFASEKSSKSVTLTDYLNLSGSVYVPSNNSYVSGYVTGWLSMRDSSGGYYTNNTYVNANLSFWASSNYVYTIVYPNVYFTVYKL